jgi:hypothetical protein
MEIKACMTPDGGVKVFTVRLIRERVSLYS